jgi:hypothetical protein
MQTIFISPHQNILLLNIYERNYQLYCGLILSGINTNLNYVRLNLRINEKFRLATYPPYNSLNTSSLHSKDQTFPVSSIVILPKLPRAEFYKLWACGRWHQQSKALRRAWRAPVMSRAAASASATPARAAMRSPSWRSAPTCCTSAASSPAPPAPARSAPRGGASRCF